MSLTRLFVQRPTLVTVFLALVLLAGLIGGSSLVQQQFPSTDVPSIQVLLTYPGTSTTEMRDAIVRPLEDQLSGTPNLDHLETSIQPGQASIVAVFSLTSDQNDDLVQVQGRLQNAQHQIPNDVQTPRISLYNPSEAVVVSLVLRSRSLSVGSLSSLAINKIVPSLEQIPGVSYVQANGTVTPSIQVGVDPQRLSSSGFTLTDIISTITNNNVRAPGGILYAPNRETNLDVRGDIQDVPTVSDLLLGSSGGRREFGRNEPLEHASAAVPHRRRCRRTRRLRNPTHVRLLGRRTVHYPRYSKIGGHERNSNLERREQGVAGSGTHVSRH